jgi:hypothetical protein
MIGAESSVRCWHVHTRGRRRRGFGLISSYFCTVSRHNGYRPFAAAAEFIGPLWASNQFNGLCSANADPAHSASKEILDFHEAVLSAAENGSGLTENLYRPMNLVDPPIDYSPLLS